jgi:hypothetical protein
VHVIVSPLGRLVLPAVALELLVIPLGLAACTAGGRVRFFALALVVSTCLYLGEPRLARFVVDRDPPLDAGALLSP